MSETHAPAEGLRAEYELDLQGESCPYPVMLTLEALSEVPVGTLVSVVTDCPQAFRNVPEEAVKHGHQLVSEPDRRGATMTFLFGAGRG